MSNSGPGADPSGSSEWDNPSWSSSLSDSSLSRPDEEPPSPWSREGASTTDPAASGPASAPSASPPATDPYQPSAPGDPYANPAGYAGPFAASGPSASEPPPPGFDPLPTPPYGEGPSGTSYGSPAPAYADPAPPYGAPPPAYGSNLYEVAAYQPAYGTSTPYGAAPPTHPQSTTAMIFGILGIVFGLSCGIGGLLGIPGIVQGRRARNEIDAQPGRYAGRSQAVAGIVTGTIGVVIAALAVVVVLVVVAGIASGDF